MRQYFTFRLSFSSIRFITYKSFPSLYNDNAVEMSFAYGS